MRYGFPYKGSKNKIAPWVIENLPSSEVFVDLFCGGCAVTHAAMLSGRWKRFIINDADPLCPLFFEKCVNGDYKDDTRWISREDFFRLKDADPYVRFCWSFGNNGMSYIYSREIEPWKKALHWLMVYKDDSLMRSFGIECPKRAEARKWIKDNADECKKKYISWYCRTFHGNADVTAEMADVKMKLESESGRLRSYLCGALRASGMSQRDVGRRLGTQMESHYFGKSQWEFPTFEVYERMREFLPLPMDYGEVTKYQALLQSLESLQRLQSLQSLESLQRLQSLESLESLQRLQSLQSLESLQRLQSLQSLQSLSGDYRNVAIPDGATVYCDPPYKGTDEYNVAFDHNEFYEWCLARDFPVFVSEYSMPEGFSILAEKSKTCGLSATSNSTSTVERIYVQTKFYNRLKTRLI